MHSHPSPRVPDAPFIGLALALALGLSPGPLPALTGDPPAVAYDRAADTFGGSPARTGASAARRLPTTWDVALGTNVRWTAELGEIAYGGPVVAAGRVFVATDNAHPRDPAAAGDAGVLMAFAADDGRFLWQWVVPKGAHGSDWPHQGMASTPTVVGDRVYVVSNRGELAALDAEGFADGEDDGLTDAPATAGARTHAADLVWKLDLYADLGVRPRFMAASSPLVVGNRVYVVTGHAPETSGLAVAKGASTPPSFLAVEALTGKVLWTDDSPNSGLVDGQWSSPSWAEGAAEVPARVLFPAGDGRIYAFEAASGDAAWAFDAAACDEASRPGCRRALVGAAAVASGRAYFGLGRDPQFGSGPGRLVALALPALGAAPTVVWNRGGSEFGLTLSTPAVAEGLVFAADLNGYLYCLDAATGSLHWSHDLFAEVWGSPFVADGKVYLGDVDGDLTVLEASPVKRLLAEINLGAAVYSTPTAVDGTLFVAARNRLFALGEVEKKP